jgi:ribonuclease HI
LADSLLLKYQAQILGGTEITLRTCQSLNPASLLPEAEGNPEHSCEEVLMENYAACPDLTDWPLKNPDLELYTNGSFFVKNGVRHAGFAVMTEFGILKSGPLPPNTSAPLAELMALTEALKLPKEQRVSIYTESKYAFLILHAHAAIWKERKMLTITGTASHRNKGGYFNSFRDHSISHSPCWNQLQGDCQSCNCKKPNQSGRGHLRPGRPCY